MGQSGAANGGGNRLFRARWLRGLGTAVCLLAIGVLLDEWVRKAWKLDRSSAYDASNEVDRPDADNHPDADNFRVSAGSAVGGVRETSEGPLTAPMLWVPCDERPIPLDAFPTLNGHIFNADGELDRVAAGSGLSNSGGGERGGGAENRPTTTLLFMHLWKCAGSSLRHLLRDWAEAKGQDIGIVVRCNDAVSEEGKICMKHHELVDEQAQGPSIRQKHVIAGHFTWGFQAHARQPYVMFTTLRNPLELFVSGQQYLHRKASRQFSRAVSLVQETMTAVVSNHEGEDAVMRSAGKNTKEVGFIYRLVDGANDLSTQEGLPKTVSMATREAKDNLDTFWLVGVIEQYEGFMAVLQAMMDPLNKEQDLWDRYAVGRYNRSPQASAKVLSGVDPNLVQDFNETLSHQWEVYSHAVDLYEHRCRQILKNTEDLGLCNVPGAPSRYALTEVEREALFQDLHPGASPFNASEMARAKRLWEDNKVAVFGDAGVQEAFFAFFAKHGFDVSDAKKKESLISRLRIDAPPLDGDGGGVGDWPASVALDGRGDAEVAAAAAAAEERSKDKKPGRNKKKQQQQ